MQQLVGIGAIVLTLAAFVLVAWLILKFIRWYEHPAQSAQAAALEGLELSPLSFPGSVEVEFYTYHGLIAWFTQTKWAFNATPEVARTALRRLPGLIHQRGLV